MPVTTSRWRYTRYHTGKEEEYDYRKDELKWQNLADDEKYAEVKKRLRSHIPYLADFVETDDSGHVEKHRRAF